MKFLPKYIVPLSAVLAFNVNSAPTVSELSTTTEGNDALISIKGSEFGNGPNVVLFDTFSRGIEGSQVDLSGSEVNEWSTNGDWAGIAKFRSGKNGNIGYGIKDWDYATNMNRHAQLEKRFDGSYREILISFDVIVPEGRYFSGASEDYKMPSASSWKFSWLIDGNSSIQQDGKYDMCIPTHVGSGRYMIAGNDGNLSSVDSGNNWWAWHDYNRITFWQKADETNPLSKGGKFLWQTVNKDKGYRSISNDAISIFKSGVTTSFDRIRFPGWFGNGDQSNFDAIYDNVYIAVGENSQARVEIGNSVNYTESTELIIFPPTSWTSSQIELKAFNLNLNQKYYVFITDSSGNRNETGYAVCSKCPEAPIVTIE
jgi:hypothetical protein